MHNVLYSKINHGIGNFFESGNVGPIHLMLPKRNHFSAWLIAHEEIQLALSIRPLRLEDFDGSLEKERHFLIGVFREVRARKQRGSIINFEARNLNTEHEIMRLSDGLLGQRTWNYVSKCLVCDDGI